MRPLSAAGSVIQGGRFNIGRDLDPFKFPTFPALYLAEDYETAYRERFGVSGDSQALQGHQLALRRPESFTSVVVQGTVLNVFDLRSDSSLRAFANIIVKFKLPDRMQELAKSLSLTGPHLARSVRQVKATLLAHDWRLFPVQYEIPSNSQVFGRLLLEAGFDGVLYRSRKGPSDCIALFPENFANSDSSVQVMDEAPAHADMLRLDSSTWRDISGATGG